jgi:hypothetical protein
VLDNDEDGGSELAMWPETGFWLSAAACAVPAGAVRSAVPSCAGEVTRLLTTNSEPPDTAPAMMLTRWLLLKKFLRYVGKFRELNLEIRRIFVHWVEVGIRRLQTQGLADLQLEPHITAEAPGAEGSVPPTGPDAIAPHLPVPMYESGDNGHYE